MELSQAAAGARDAGLLLSLLKDELRKLIARLANDEPQAAREVPTLMRDLSRALQTAVDQEANLAKLQFETGVGGGALDLDAARSEIGRRLARLRAAGPG